MAAWNSVLIYLLKGLFLVFYNVWL